MHACTYTKCELCDENYFSMTFNVRLNAYISYSKERYTDREKSESNAAGVACMCSFFLFSYYRFTR